MNAKKQPEILIRADQVTASGALRMSDLNALGNLLRSRGVVLVPSDTCYGLAAIPIEVGVSQRVNDILNREREPISLSFSRLELVYQYAQLSVLETRLIEALTPGPITVVCKASPSLPDRFTTGALDAPKTIGVRIPDSQIERQLVDAANYPITTAAVRDPKTRLPVRDFEKALDIVGRGIARLRPDSLGSIVLFGAIESPGEFLDNVSTVVEVKKNGAGSVHASIKREGAISQADIDAAIQRISSFEIQDWT